MADLAAYSGLFGASLLAATLLPFGSEALLVWLLIEARQPWWGLVLAASLGNVAGAVLNWALGRFALRYGDRRWFPVTPEALERARGWYRRYGRWSLLLSWAPVIGDPLTVAAGLMREPLGGFLVLVALGKTARYLVVAAATLGWA